MLKKLTFLLIAATISVPAAAAEKADRVLTNGNIETMNVSQLNAEAVAMKDGEILFVGLSEDAEAYIGRKTDVIDLDGRYVTPGLIESHNHVIASKWTTAGVDLSSARSVEDVGRMLKEYADGNPDEEGPMVGFGWTLANLSSKYPRAKDLDAWDIRGR